MVDSLAQDGEHRTYVLDTNVLLYDPRALFVFDEHDIVIPITVIEEVDTFKKDLSETGRNARQVSRTLDAMRRDGSLSDGVTMPGGGSLSGIHAFGGAAAGSVTIGDININVDGGGDPEKTAEATSRALRRELDSWSAEMAGEAAA